MSHADAATELELELAEIGLSWMAGLPGQRLNTDQ